MGLGSDSEPVPISFLGQHTHLADSMQFSLEYFLRIEDGAPGVYYTNTSFRGEDPDAMHLNQFYHVECELLGSISQAIAVAENYIVQLVIAILRNCSTAVEACAGDTEHLERLLKYYNENDQRFPSISVDDALNLPSLDETCWKYVIPGTPASGRTVTRAGELKLMQYFGGPVWLTEMDHLGVPFYQAFTDSKNNKARCADLLFGNGEVLGLGERHTTSAAVRQALEMHEILQDKYSWYTEMRDLKPLLTSGWGMGIE